ncbi:hypothetical protein BLNAU_6643 [Blattamonas nauphoetae]|uniref:Uncharacterized protein n=1 Tax=Blattamonas nauphoetae TaxID=2049346 RepID=A0ABQ9Y3U8_9EUKA|nr:hypothetical protein BLNAU_6643 [Blattamonas nauphoetae]
MDLCRINIETMLKQAPLKDDAISLPTSFTSDWRLVLQDSITADTLRLGCISLFEQVNSGQNLTPIEVTHAVRFLKYASIHTQYRIPPYNKLLEPLLSEEVHGRRKVTSALLKLVAHPSNTLQTAALSFLDAIFSISSRDTLTAVTVTELLSQFIKTLNPLELPLNGTTTKFHRHLTSTLDNFFYNFATEEFRRRLGIDSSSSRVKAIQSQNIETIITSSLKFFRYLIAPPGSPTDTLSGFVHLSTMRQFDPIMIDARLSSRYPEIQCFFREIQKDIVEELASMLDLPSTDEAELCLLLDWRNPETTEPWLKGFEYLLGRVSEGTKLSDLGTLAVAFFLSHRPHRMSLFFSSDDEFGLKLNAKIVSSSKLDVKSLWTLFTPTQPQHAATVLTAFNRFMNHGTSLAATCNLVGQTYSVNE